MSTKVTKFSDLLNTKEAFAPLASPPTPLSQFATLSSTEESSEASSLSDEPMNKVPSDKSEAKNLDQQGRSPAPQPDSTDVSSSDSSDAESDASEESMQSTSPVDPTAFPKDSSKTDETHPAATKPSPMDSEGAPLPDSMEESQVDAPAEDTPIEATNLDAQVDQASTKGLERRVDEKKASLQDALPVGRSTEAFSTTRAGSVFNLQGLDQAFPMQSSERESFSLVSSSKALQEAAKMGVKLTANSLSKPKTTRLADGSLLLTAPAKAVSMARVAPSCAAALNSMSKSPERLLQPLKILRAFDLATHSPQSLEELTTALRSLRGDDLLSCAPDLIPDVEKALSMLDKVGSAIGQQTSAELIYLKHVNEFRAMKSDLRALSDVLKVDGARVSKMREKVDELVRRRGSVLSGRLEKIEQTLLQLRTFYKEL